MDKKKEILSGLQPQTVFKYFEEISQIPRPSGKEEKIIRYLIDFAETHSLTHKKDKAGNLLITKPATSGREHCQTVVVQSHVDMVVEKNSNAVFDGDNDPISIYTDNGWIKAHDTTLGADCGIGVAASLALLADETVRHGKLECLFTVDEERGLSGAHALEPGFFSGKTLINLDSEDEGELFIGCAGGVNTIAKFAYLVEPTPSDYIAYKLSICGLLGGHSGDDINKGRANAIKVLVRFLWRMSRKFDFRISHCDGGNKINAIPREAHAVLTVHRDLNKELIDCFNVFRNNIEDEFGRVETNVSVNLVEVETPEYVIDELTQFELFAATHACPSGPMRMSDDLENLVETSTNLSSIKFVNNEIIVSTSQRSSIESKKQYAMDLVMSLFSLTNARIEVSEGYPGWKPNVHSKILQISKTIYERLFNTQPLVKAVHAGLECGLFLEKYPDLDMISIGPTIKDPHSPTEKLEIASVAKFMDLLNGIIEEIGNC